MIASPFLTLRSMALSGELDLDDVDVVVLLVSEAPPLDAATLDVFTTIGSIEVAGGGYARGTSTLSLVAGDGTAEVWLTTGPSISRTGQPIAGWVVATDPGGSDSSRIPLVYVADTSDTDPYVIPTSDALIVLTAPVTAAHVSADPTAHSWAVGDTVQSQLDGLDAAITGGGGGDGVPDPSGEPDGQVLTVDDGAAVWAAPAGGGGGDVDTVAGVAPDTGDVPRSELVTALAGDTSADLAPGDHTHALADLTDVDLATPPTDGQALVWDEDTDQWVPATIEGGGGGPLALDDLTDVAAPAPADGQVLTWDDDEAEWIAATPAAPPAALGELTDVDLTTPPADTDLLGWDDSDAVWIPVARPSDGDPGPAGLTWQGPWADTTIYAEHDAVSHDGASWICTAAHTASSATEPGVGVDWATAWDSLAAAGDDGDPGPVTTVAGVADTAGDIPAAALAVSLAGTSSTTLAAGDDPRFTAVQVRSVSSADSLDAADAGGVVEVDDDAPVTITIDPEATTAFPAGAIVEVWRADDEVTIAPGSGVTLLAPGQAATAADGVAITEVHGTATLRYRGSDVWAVDGRIEIVP